MLRIEWEYSFGNNMYHFIIAKLLSKKYNMKLSYTNDSRWTKVKDVSKAHAKILTDPIEYFNLLNIDLKYYPEVNPKVLLTNKRQLENINQKFDYILTRKNAWNFFKKEDFIKHIADIKGWFPEIKEKNKKDLVVHARLGKDFYRKNRVPDFDIIKNLISDLEYEKIYICTDAPDDDYIEKFKSLGKECIVVSKGTRLCDLKTGYFLNEVKSDLIINDFNFIRSFDKILLTSPDSTYSFLAAALSDASFVKFDLDKVMKASRAWFAHELFE